MYNSTAAKEVMLLSHLSVFLSVYGQDNFFSGGPEHHLEFLLSQGPYNILAGTD